MHCKFALAAAVALLFFAWPGFAQDRVSPTEARAATPASPSTPAAAPVAESSPELLIGPGDLVEVSLFGVPDFKTDVRVSSEGDVSLPMLGSVPVAGLSVEKAAKLVETKLTEKRLYNNPHITVFEKEYATQGISVLGEVQRPGIYPLLGAHRLYDAISAAGGTTPKAGGYALITRRGDPDHSIRVPLSLGAPDSMDNNVAVEPGDTILVSKGGVVYVVGDVRQPGGFVLENGKSLTVLQAVALAQGPNPNAALNSARLIRKTDNGREDIPLALKKILAAKATDVKLQAGDVLFVPNSAGKSVAKRSAETILQMATGIAIWRIP